MGPRHPITQPSAAQPKSWSFIQADSTAAFRAYTESATPATSSDTPIRSSDYYSSMGFSPRRNTLDVLSRRAMSGPIERSPACIPFSFSRSNVLPSPLEPSASLPASFRTTSAHPAAASPRATASRDTGASSVAHATVSRRPATQRSGPVSQPFTEAHRSLYRRSPVAVSNPIDSDLDESRKSMSGPINPSASASISRSFLTPDSIQSGPISFSAHPADARNGSRPSAYYGTATSSENPSARLQGRRVRFADEVLSEDVRADGNGNPALETRKQFRSSHASARTTFSGQHLNVNIPRWWSSISQSTAAFALPPPPLSAAGAPSTPPAIVT